MDFNPLNILASAALGDKDAPSDVKSGKSGQSSGPGETDSSESAEAQDADDNTEAEMGKTGKNSVKTLSFSKDFKSDEKMAPQKAPWSPDSLIQLPVGDDMGKKSTFSLDELVQDIKAKGLEVEFQKILDKSLGPTIENLETADIMLKHGQNNNLVAVKNAINDVSDKQSDVPSDLTEQKAKDEEVEAKSSLDNTNSSNSESADSPTCPVFALDHSYALAPGQTKPLALEQNEDGDVSSNNFLIEESEQRASNLSLECSYLKSGIQEGVSASTLDFFGVGRSKIPSCSSSTSSPIDDLGPKSPQRSDIHQCGHPSESSISSLKTSPKFGKFKIGTFASFSSSNLELEKHLRNREPLNHKKLNIGIPDSHLIHSSSLGSPTIYSSVQPLLQSPSLDWDRSEAGSEAQDDSSDGRTPLRLSPDFTSEKVTEWSHPLFHDHDYCAKDAVLTEKPDDLKKFAVAKRKYVKRKNKLDNVNHEKIMKAKYLKKELLRQDSCLRSPSGPELTEQISSDIEKNLAVRSRKRPLEKETDMEIDPETGTKMKITGKFKDDYVYYLSKSSRSTTRRRQPPTLPMSADRIIVPAPKPGDIFVPHLTDADIETVRLKGRSALNLPARPHMPNVATSVVQTSHSSSVSQNTNTVHTSESILDDDSHIVSTILSMENDNLASPVTSQAPTDVPSAAELNPHQPALTESLRMMSGDSSITSEHVLNYLLSVVKDDGLVNGANSFESSSSALFPSISPDAIYSKADISDSSGLNSTSLHSSETSVHDLLGTKKIPPNVSTLPSSSILSSPSVPSHSDVSTQNVFKDHHPVDLPDDFSSFMSSSQETSVSSTTQDVDSRNMFGSDLSTLDSPHVPNSYPRLTSIEKTLDYLGVKDGDIKLDTNSLNSSYSDTSHGLPTSLDTYAELTSLSHEDDTPWIVTVTLYFNDLPAIMINNQPFIRLVDIHKQILPAKDTGILKKRCQLLKIPVENCTDMQRYFLVQYGRAYNSKSTLVISKDQATTLVSYYAMPQPRICKGEDSAPYRRPSSAESGTRSPLSYMQQGNPKKKFPKNSKKSGLVLEDPDLPRQSAFISETLGLPNQSAEHDSSHGKRTRHKKVNYLELLKGEEKEKKSPEDSILETIEAVVRSAPDYDAFDKHRNKKSSKKRRDKDKKSKKSKKSRSKIISSNGLRTSKSSKKHVKKISKKQKHDLPELIREQTGLDSHDPAQGGKKSKPLKLKVGSLLNFSGSRRASATPHPPNTNKKNGLFSRSTSVVEPSTSRPLRVLAVAHQAAISGHNTESRLPSQPADIHLDLFTKSNSACVRCQTCSQYLSVPHFMRHHHVAIDNEWLATEAAHRILVPRNKENISEQEKRLWEEFHRLQEAIGGFGTDEETDSDDDDGDSHIGGGKEAEGDSEESDYEHCSLEIGGISPDHSSKVDGNRDLKFSVANTSKTFLPETFTGNDPEGEIIQNKKTVTSSISGCSSRPLNKPPKKAPEKVGLIRRDLAAQASSKVSVLSIKGIKGKSSPRKVTPPLVKAASTLFSSAPNGNVRTSSRKRKSKQFFDIENYDVSPKKDPDSNVVVTHE